MGLREQAALDAAVIIGDQADGFGWPALVANPDGDGAELSALVNDIDSTIDPDTGAPAKGRAISATFAISDLDAAGLGALISGVSSDAGKPWTVTFCDLQGNEQIHKVSESRPDRTLGIVVCLLEFYHLQPAG